ncbi:hypothetical protein [Winogradskyella immobilis]|uniref:Uncharacterized protein n=1 Tax=Winogradskyella immobilis TaxID=2816852 RepID=A0ABS8EKA7_9FLAO|nr:hypothetical protein [Winogradskyella immobilis]MCC1483653.1 hypothetical protein [Winogradskyella immobilis]MCG0015747.1 hypothetical protein [Winogradskyella immobilis]
MIQIQEAINNRTFNLLVKLSIIAILLFNVSCGKSSSNQSESELINRINAVQQQIMVQGNITKQEEQAILSLCSIMTHDDGLANFSPDNRMILKDVDIVPIYEGCEDLSKEETRECFKNKIVAFIKREFNVGVSKDLNLSEPKQVDAFFVIDENGNRTGMKVRDSEVTIQAEILRVLRKMPVMKPAIHNGKNVSVLCSILIKYGDNIEIDVVYIPERPNNWK